MWIFLLLIAFVFLMFVLVCFYAIADCESEYRYDGNRNLVKVYNKNLVRTLKFCYWCIVFVIFHRNSDYLLMTL